jgi:hypothetical protein
MRLVGEGSGFGDRCQRWGRGGFAKGCGFSCGAEVWPASFSNSEVCYDD